VISLGSTYTFEHGRSSYVHAINVTIGVVENQTMLHA
jgi:hypothetical protein